VTQGLCVHLCGVAELANHPPSSLAKFGYKQDMKFKKKKGLRFLHIFRVHARTQWRNLTIFYYLKKII
jgi:hypothetical protein